MKPTDLLKEARNLKKVSPSHPVSETGLVVPVVLLEENALFPENTLPLSCLDHLRRQDIKRAEAGTLQVLVLGHRGQRFATVGTLAQVSGLLKLPDGQTGVVLKGEHRVFVRELLRRRKLYLAKVDVVNLKKSGSGRHLAAMVKTLKSDVNRLLKADLEISDPTRSRLQTTGDPQLLCDLILPYLSLSFFEKLHCLAEFDPLKRMKLVMNHAQKELNLQKLSQEIHDRVKGDLSEEQRRYYLKEQIVAIRRELGELEDAGTAFEQFEEAFDKLRLPKMALEAVNEELERLNMSTPGSPEYMVAHSYLSLVRDLPWQSEPPPPPRLAEARRILDRHHYGLRVVKERILEYLAVLRHKGEIPGQILLLNGPPGVGKTSLARSIAESLKRPFARIALGGVKDEAEIRGHRRTYIGSMPGKIIQAMKQTQSLYPVILLDEIDKIGGDKLHGLEAALLEVLDREQNQGFLDHYLAVPFDISNVLFIATSNSEDSISTPLYDRMEVIDVASYTDIEKLAIAKKHIIPALRKELDLRAGHFRLQDEALTCLIRGYTREAGVRQLKREISRLGRKVVKHLVEDRPYQMPNRNSMQQWLGVPRFLDEPNDKVLPPGVAVGLAYTSVGGEILYIETSRSRLGSAGKGGLKLTGSLGKVMQESAQAALSYLATHAVEIGVAAEEFLAADFHLHLPDGGTPKDGPSAGIAILCALLGQVLGLSVASDIAMTGEITLRGQVLAVGGIREKVLAAYRYGKRRIIYPKANEFDLSEVPEDVRQQLELIPVATMEEALLAAGMIAAPFSSLPRPTTGMTVLISSSSSSSSPPA